VTGRADHAPAMHDERDRPLSVTLAAWLFIIVGAGGIL
jgi:hypothetical protein